MIDAKKTLELMVKAEWTAPLFKESINSAIHMENSLRPKNAHALLTSEQADDFFKTGRLDGDFADWFEKWAGRRQGGNGVSTTTFPKPEPMTKLNMVSAPLLLPAETELAQDGPEIRLNDITNQKARAKMLADARDTVR
ncbi:hypothetical protein [Mesorhizobium wenxiniae]|uniref:Uncharacterized protein n=1 Tax=Mesorhizobium wenxiniae TaxID=2014805 RepID=A0A271K6K1_9HYPH|nr:hypothetical protein [Mesorhizobium wenxiniae]PAP91396.1 hypothetical protein CIT31_32490 [Mesorhizobium wenxiniae]